MYLAEGAEAEVVPGGHLRESAVLFPRIRGFHSMLRAGAGV